MPAMTVPVCDLLGAMADQMEYDTGRRPTLEELYEQEFGDPMENEWDGPTGNDLYGKDYDLWLQTNCPFPSPDQIEADAAHGGPEEAF